METAVAYFTFILFHSTEPWRSCTAKLSLRHLLDYLLYIKYSYCLLSKNQLTQYLLGQKSMNCRNHADRHGKVLVYPKLQIRPVSIIDSLAAFHFHLIFYLQNAFI